MDRSAAFPAAPAPLAELSGPAARRSLAADWMTTPAGSFTSSLLLPGSGQAALGLRRWIVYGAAEVGLWVLRLDARSDERRFRGRYRDLAWDVARVQLPGERQDGGWGYYEAMSQYLSSGDYDVDPATTGLQPETDRSTYNGAVWDLARGLFLRGQPAEPGAPDYLRALAYYSDHAAGPAFLWSWDGHEPELERFRGLVDRSDDAARLASGALGLVLANHLVAAVDALVVARLRAEDGVRLESTLDPTGPVLRWHIQLSLTTPY